MRYFILAITIALALPAGALEIQVTEVGSEEQAIIMEACGEHDRAARIDGVATIEQCIVELVNAAAPKLLMNRVRRLRETSLRDDQRAKLDEWRTAFERQADLRVCGDAEPDEGEECDPGDGNFDSTTPDSGCRPGCRDPYCGDGVKDRDEVCDPGATRDCKPDCSGELP